ncbi:MAG: hypothetical protein WAS21_27100 [Geminicoccaceae bacterium]
MRRLVAALLLSLLALIPSARATDIGGVWNFDQAAWAAQTDKLMAAMLAALAPQDLAAMKASGIDVEKAYREGLSEPIDGAIEFLPGGRLRVTAAGEETVEEGTWALHGDQLRVEYPNGEQRDALEGSVAGDRIVLKPVITDPSSPDAPVLDAIVVTLVRGR